MTTLITAAKETIQLTAYYESWTGPSWTLGRQQKNASNFFFYFFIFFFKSNEQIHFQLKLNSLARYCAK